MISFHAGIGEVKRRPAAAQDAAWSVTATEGTGVPQMRSDGQASMDQSPRMVEQRCSLQALFGPDDAARAPNRTGMPSQLKASIESLSGVDLSDVRVHRNSLAPTRMGAMASARGYEIHLAHGQEAQLPHEAWHVVQQAQGRVEPTMTVQGVEVNDDRALEQEADVMGARASAMGDGGPVPAQLRRPSLRPATTQLAAPGGIRHVANSCFVAAIINIFTVTPSLKNLLNPDAHMTAPLPSDLETLRNLLFRAVNTVDATAEVPALWVTSIMMALAAMGGIDHAEASEDVNTVLGFVVQRLQARNEAAGQHNERYGGGTCPWSDGQAINDAAAAQYADPALLPNAIFFNRVSDPMRLAAPLVAPETFQMHGGDHVLTYRLTSIIERNAEDYVDRRGNKAAHFVSYVDRSGRQNEWWRSDDIGPSVTTVNAIDALGQVGGPGREPASGKSSGPEIPKSSGFGKGAEPEPTELSRTILSSIFERRKHMVDDEDADTIEDDWSDDEEPASRSKTSEKSVLPVTTALPAELPTPSTGATGESSVVKEEGSSKAEVQALSPAQFDATRDGLTYVYQIETEVDIGTHGGLNVGNPPGGTQAVFDALMVRYAENRIGLLEDPGKAPQARRFLLSALFVPSVHDRITSDKSLFRKLYASIKDPAPHKGHHFDPDPEIDKRKREQRIHSISDQLHYLASRLGSGPKGLANDPGFSRKTGTELLSEINQTTAKEAQASTLAKLIAQYVDPEVRLPTYLHRAGPMLGRTTQNDGHGMTMGQYNAKAASTYQEILSSKDEAGSSIRVTDAAAGLGAYVSTDGDNFYGPHGFAFDRRDIHQLPLSSQSTDNLKEHSAERTSEKGQQFRAIGKPIPFVVDGRSHVADYFVGTGIEQSKDLSGTLDPSSFNEGILPITAESVLRDHFRERLGVAPLAKSHTSTEHDQPKGAEEVALMADLLQELEGLYEPLEWAELWQQAQKDNPFRALLKAMHTKEAQGNKKSDDKQDGDNDGEDDDVPWS